MADGIKVQLVGHRDVIAAVKELREYLPSSFLRTSVRKAAQFLEDFIVENTPRRTSKLARNISVKTHETNSTIRARVTVNTVGKADNPANAFYWRFLEKGWHDRAGVEHVLPFVMPAIDSHERDAAQIVIDSVEQAIVRAEAKAARATPSI